MQHDPIALKNTALAITERCTLRCKLCFAYIPYHENPRDMSLSEIRKILDRYFSIVTSVDNFCVTGGEPLLHPDLVQILQMLTEYSNQIMKRIDLITNGTLSINSDLMKLLVANTGETRVIISDYGRYSPKAEAIAQKLRAAGVTVRVEKYSGESPLYGGWLDCTDHSLKHATQHDVDEQGKRCYFKNKRGYTIRKGQLHNCGRSYWRMLNHIIPNNREEYLDLLDESITVAEQREILRALHQKISVTSCAYCSADADLNRHRPAEQLDLNNCKSSS